MPKWPGNGSPASLYADLVGDVVGLGNLDERPALPGVRAVEGAREELDAFAQALDEAEPVVVEGRLHHLEQMIRVGMGGAGDKRRAGGEGVPQGGIDRLVDRTPDVRLALEPER